MNELQDMPRLLICGNLKQLAGAGRQPIKIAGMMLISLGVLSRLACSTKQETCQGYYF